MTRRHFIALAAVVGEAPLYCAHDGAALTARQEAGLRAGLGLDLGSCARAGTRGLTARASYAPAGSTDNDKEWRPRGCTRRAPWPALEVQ
jgi:hypothetical protein